MADVSQDNRDIIRKHSLGDALDDVRDNLQKAERLYESDQNTYDRAAIDSACRKATTPLLTSLMVLEVAHELRSNRNRNLASELGTIFSRIANGDFNYEHYRALVRLVIEKASDLDIWRAVIDLITSLSRTSPPTSIPPSFEGTPIVRSSASFQGDEQTKNRLNIPLFDEIKHCTYRNVDGFFAKYFEGKAWSARSKEIYETMKARHVDGRWVDFPDPAVQDDVLKWLFQFQEEHLSDSSGAYYTTQKTKDLVGAEARRQVDLLVERRRSTSSDTDYWNDTHKWKDILIVAELKQSTNGLKPVLLQLSRYIRDVYAAQPTRRFVHGFFLHGTTMELWVFDRSGPYSSGEFDIHKKPERFICALAGYTLMSDNELGLDNFIQRDDDNHFITITEYGTEKETKITIEQEPMVRQQAIVCRGTTCFLSKDLEQVIKLSWPPVQRLSEAHHLQRARNYDVKGVARLIGHHDITSIKDMRDGLTFPAPQHFQNISPDPSLDFTWSQMSFPRSFGVVQSASQSKSSLGKRKLGDTQSTPSKRSRPYSLGSNVQGSSSQRSNSNRSKLSDKSETKRSIKYRTESQQDLRQETFKNREFRCLVISPAGRRIATFSSVVELLTALRDAIKAHQSLFENAKILHRDISENNIIITDPKTADGFTGMLIDLDLAIVDGERSRARHITGTMEFMAIEVLRGVEHTYRHDLESFFYVLLWICARRAWDMQYQCWKTDRPTKSNLRRWYEGSLEDIADAKEHHMGVNGFKGILREFAPAFDCVKPLCREIRGVLFPVRDDGGLDTSTRLGAKKLYDIIIGAFDDAIAEVTNRQPLPSRAF